MDASSFGDWRIVSEYSLQLFAIIGHLAPADIDGQWGYLTLLFLLRFRCGEGPPDLHPEPREKGSETKLSD